MVRTSGNTVPTALRELTHNADVDTAGTFWVAGVSTGHGRTTWPPFRPLGAKMVKNL